MQQEAHDRAFGTAPLDDLLELIAAKLPGIQETAMVSKWDSEGLKKYEGMEQVDVTMALVDAFEPTERQRGYAVEIQAKKPVE